MKHKWLPKEERKTMLFLSDDMRVPSGIGTMTREIIEGTCHRYNWVQLGAAIDHPEAGSIVDLSDDVSNRTDTKDASVVVYPFNGYGDQFILRHLMQDHNPSAILHFTDPRYWDWLYNMENEVRQDIPIFFYTIWDDLPYPYYNANFYRSCDWLGCISKQTYNIVKQVRAVKEPVEDWQLSYVPHGINPDKFYKIKEDDEEYEAVREMRNRLFGDKEYKFVLFYNSRNIRRKMTSDIMMAFNQFRDQLPDDEKDDVVLLMHTEPSDDNGTDLRAVHRDLFPDINLVFTESKFEQDGINGLYNIADVTINISSNEGFGLSVAESLMTETPVIVNVTGGLQDQCGFRDEEGNFLDPDIHYTFEQGSNHNGKYKDHGEWVIPVFPAAINIVGSPVTPYIFDDRCTILDVTNAIMSWYQRGDEKRRKAGLAGKEFCLGDGGLNSENMCNLFIESMDTAMTNFKPRQRFFLEAV
jgi:glycosyltransferase involved in cell wall biosynthesis